MVTVTERAKQELGKILTSADVPNPETCLRLVSGESGRFGLALDEEEVGDQVVEHEGAKILLVDQGVAQQLEGATIDCQDTAEGTELRVSRQ